MLYIYIYIFHPLIYFVCVRTYAHALSGRICKIIMSKIKVTSMNRRGTNYLRRMVIFNFIFFIIFFLNFIFSLTNDNLFWENSIKTKYIFPKLKADPNRKAIECNIYIKNFCHLSIVMERTCILYYYSMKRRYMHRYNKMRVFYFFLRSASLMFICHDLLDL